MSEIRTDNGDGQARHKTGGKVWIIGLDGATFDLLDPWMEAGLLPNIRRLMEGGARGNLRSTIPPMTFPAWTSFQTGKNPGKHGIFDFTERKPNSYEVQFVNARSRRARTMWQIASDAGKKVGTVRVPVTFPPDPVEGFVIAGFEAPGLGGGFTRQAVHPPEVYDLVKEAIPDYRITPNAVKYSSQGRMDKALEMMLFSLDVNLRATLLLAKKYDPDLMMIVFGESDTVGHYFWKDHDPESPRHDPDNCIPDAIKRIYCRLDEAVGELVDAAPEDATIILVSDHGFGGVGARSVQMGTWLEQEGYLTFKGSNGSDAGPKSSREQAIIRALDRVRQVSIKLLPPFVKSQIFRRGAGLVNRMESFIRFGRIDWPGTRVYSEEMPYGPAVWINRKGREPEGIVEPGTEYDALRAEVKQRLEEFRNPATGDKMLEHVWFREEVYTGPYVDKAPDLILDWALDGGYTYGFETSGKNGRHEIVRELSAAELSLPGNRNKNGSHRHFGILSLTGPSIVSGGRLEGAHITDVAPTALYLLGVPVPDDLDGAVLEQAFVRETLTAAPVGHAAALEAVYAPTAETYSEEEEEEIRARLEGLGYLE